ncbi:hypothetical protein [Sulfitobacter donghicola]|nr:hypothetical protein [Sulfitobacter donghicola]
MRNFFRMLQRLGLMFWVMAPVAAFAATIEQFEGTYEGEAEFILEGETKRRDMSTSIEMTKKGFIISWTSVTYKGDGRTKTKSYSIPFSPSERDNIYKSTMRNNVFGKATPLDPLQGEPFVWARLVGDTLSLFSLFINDVGEYEMQEFHRTLMDGDLGLVFRLVHNGTAEREIHTILKRVE